jgi:signal transduction histidine kinase
MFGKRLYRAHVTARLPARIRPSMRDAALAAGVVVLGQIEVWANAHIAPKPAAAACEAVLGAALAWRRRLPLAAITVAAVAGTAEALANVPLQEPLVPLLVYVIVVYSLVAYAPRERALAGALIGLAGVAVQTASQHKGLGNFTFAAVFLGAAWVVGRTIHKRTEHAERLEREQEQLAASTAEAERRRIARELHDVISHGLGVVMLQAGAAEQMLERDPARARQALQAIRTTGQEAIAELGTLLAVVRGEVESSREPQPALVDLERLLAASRDAGLPVELEVRGQRRDLPAPIELSVYRIVQEGLTNARKHAGPARARVSLDYRAEELEVQVEDDGIGGGAGNGSRRGLIGVRERVAVFGGHYQAGPRAEGGWRLQAILPLPR